VYWSAWGSDWDPLPPARIAELVGRDLADGVIVLLHDSARYADRDSAAATAQALTLLGERALEAGLAFGTLGDAVG
jgi:hypothetical protein